MLQGELPDLGSKWRAGALGGPASLLFLCLALVPGNPLLGAPPAALTLSSAQPGKEEPAPYPQTLDTKVYPLPVNPILKISPKIPNIQENLALAPPAVPPAEQENLIDLSTALRLAQADNPNIAISLQAIQVALANQLQAQAMVLPTLRAGLNYHLHDGVLQTSAGEIRHVDETSIYFGAGSRALAAETVAFPGVQFFSHLGDAYFAPLAARQNVGASRARADAKTNLVLLDAATRFMDLMRAEGQLAALQQSEKEMNLIVQTTAAFFKAGQGRDADARRAQTEALLLHAQKQGMEETLAVAAAELARVLHLDPSVRLRTPAKTIAVLQLVDPKLTLEQLLSIAVSARPELAALQADIARAQTLLRQEQIRPFLPTVSVGYSAGGFGGGTNRSDLVPVHPGFGRIDSRTDLDVIAYWTLQNLGAGNRALQNMRRAERSLAEIEEVRMINQVRREVADALALTQARRRQLGVAQQRLAAAENGLRLDYLHVRARRGLPLEVINSMDRLVDARIQFIGALADFNQAQFQLFVALGQRAMP